MSSMRGANSMHADGGVYDDTALLSALAFMDDIQLPSTPSDDELCDIDLPSASSDDELEVAFSMSPDATGLSPTAVTTVAEVNTPVARSLVSHVAAHLGHFKRHGAGTSTSISTVAAAATAGPTLLRTRPLQLKRRTKLTSATTPTKPKATSRSSSTRGSSSGSTNKARDRRKEELIYLRKTVVELERQLAESKQRLLVQPTASPRTGGSEPHNTTTAAPATSTQQQQSTRATRRAAEQPSVWVDIVRRQQSQRARAERENIRLKLVLEHQLKVAKSLEKMVQKSACTKEFDKVLHPQQQQRFYWAMHSPPPLPDAADTHLIDELLAGLDQSYVEAESVFEANGLARKVRTTPIDAVVRADDACGIRLEVFASKELPFDMRAAGNVVWNHYAFAKDRLPNRLYHHNAPQMLNPAQDTMIEDHNLEIIDENDSSAMYRERKVLRKYTEEHRIVIVLRGYSDTVRIADEPTDGVRFLERGYFVIREVKPPTRGRRASSNSPEDAAAAPTRHVLQTCYITTPVANGILADADASKIAAITDYVIRATAANISSSHEIIENVLLEQAAKATRIGPDGLAGLTNG